MEAAVEASIPHGVVHLRVLPRLRFACLTRSKKRIVTGNPKNHTANENWTKDHITDILLRHGV